MALKKWLEKKNDRHLTSLSFFFHQYYKFPSFSFFFAYLYNLPLHLVGHLSSFHINFMQLKCALSVVISLLSFIVKPISFLSKKKSFFVFLVKTIKLSHEIYSVMSAQKKKSKIATDEEKKNE